MSCSARLPVYILFVGAFFTAYQGIILISLYLLGILLAIFSGLLFKRIFFKNETSDLILEIPPYRIPTLSGALIHMWERGKQFIYKAGTLILSASIVIWFFSNLPIGVAYASKDSFIGQVGSFVAPILSPLGFGEWQAAVALIFGVVAKEVVVSTFATIYGVSDIGLTGVIQSIFTPLSAYAFMVMTLIYIPCLATITTIKNETGSWMLALMLATYTLILGWVFALIIYRGGVFLGFG
jgi:ferrous iron transport protein B